MLRLFRAAAVVGLVGGLLLLANADDPKPGKKAEPPDSAEVRFADGSVVRMQLAQSSVEITTRYGKLTVPIEDIRKIEFGFRYPDGVKEKIDSAVGKLSLNGAKEREAAVQELLGFRELAYPALKRLAAGTNTDLATRANEVIRKLEDKVGADKLRVQDLDTIHAAEFVVTGHIEAPTFKGRTTYFGEVTVQVAELRTIRFLGGGGEMELAIDAAKYAALTRDVWLDTEVDVHEGNTLEITASGIVDLYPSGGNYKVGPDAMPRHGQSPDGTPSGMLIGRIGEKGKTFQVGAKFSQSANDSGRLYLRIECSPWNNASTGSYVVKINSNADGGAPMAPPPIKKKFKNAGIAKEK
jgi:hypothetical protein